MAAKLWFGFEHVPSNTNKELKTFLVALKKALGDDFIHAYLDDKYDYAKASTQLEIKITDPEAIKRVGRSLKAKYDMKSNGPNFTTSKLVKVKLYASGGMRGSGKLPRKGESQKNPTTPEQESGTIVYLREKLRGKDPSLKFIQDQVGYAFGDDWMWNFQEQHKALVKGISVKKNSNIYLDSDKNDSDIIVDLAKKFGLKDLKDNWNPADIWIMSIPGSKIRTETSGFTTLPEYNSYLEDKFNASEVIGVSLKKIEPKKKGSHKIVSVKDMKKVDLQPGRVLFDPFQKNFIFETKGNIAGFNLRVGYKAASITKDSDIRIYLEGRQKSSTVQLGGVSSKLFPDLAKQFGGFNISKDKTAIFKDPKKFLKDNQIRHSAVTHKGGVNPDATELELRAAAFLTYYLKILIESDPEILNKCYYSATKTNDFSSIHLKVY